MRETVELAVGVAWEPIEMAWTLLDAVAQNADNLANKAERIRESQVAGGRNTPRRRPPYEAKVLVIGGQHHDRLAAEGKLSLAALTREMVQDERIASLIPARITLRTLTPLGQASYGTVERWAKRVIQAKKKAASR